MHISFVHHRPSRQKYTSSPEYMQIYVYANTYAHRPHIPLSRATLLVNNAFHGEISVHDNKIREIESVTMIAQWRVAYRARFVRTSFWQTVETEKWRISSTRMARVSIVIEKWARPKSGNGRALFALEQWGSIKSRGFVYSRIIHLRVRRTNGCDL